jgi:hypothetical protein
MADFDNVLQQLRSQHKQAQATFEKLQQAISTIASLNGNSAGTTVNGARPSLESNPHRQTPNNPTQDHEEFQPQVESESLPQPEPDGHE